MSRKYKLNLSAKQDLKNIYGYGLQRWRELQADTYFAALFKAFEKISDQPEAYPKADEIKFGYRRCVCGVESIYFRVINEMVEIMTIVGHQDVDDL